MTITELKVRKVRYLADYGCGCTDVQDRPIDLPDICANHGDNRLGIRTISGKHISNGLLPHDGRPPHG